MRNSRQKAKLVFQDGSFFEGFLFGSPVSTAGEAVFQTGMVGYPEAMTDPSYFGQILVFTYPLIGNYGVPPQTKSKEGFFLPASPDEHTSRGGHFESDHIQPKGIVVADYSAEYSHWQAVQSLEAWMRVQSIPGITGVDTRAITKKLREQGTMLAQIVVGEKQVDWYDPNASDVLAQVSCTEAISYGSGDVHILFIDCGAKEGIIRSLVKRGARVTRVPYNADISDYAFDGVVVSNGPGDPKLAKEPIAAIKKLLTLKTPKPLFGVCLGSQLLALAAGADTAKLAYGHRSQNQPCQDIESKRCYITSQNHGFAVQEKTLPKEWHVWFRNISDQTVEGIRHEKKPFWAVQFHPEASPGPTDTGFLFDSFLELCRHAK